MDGMVAELDSTCLRMRAAGLVVSLVAACSFFPSRCLCARNRGTAVALLRHTHTRTLMHALQAVVLACRKAFLARSSILSHAAWSTRCCATTSLCATLPLSRHVPFVRVCLLGPCSSSWLTTRNSPRLIHVCSLLCTHPPLHS